MKKRISYGKGTLLVRRCYVGAKSINTQLMPKERDELILRLIQQRADNPDLPVDLCVHNKKRLTVTRVTTKAEREA